MQVLIYGRHGQTVDLKAGLRSSPGTLLTEEGWGEARRAGELLAARHIMPDLIVCSELPRSSQSGRIIAEAIGYKGRIEQNPLLNERDCGVAVGLPNAYIKERWPGGFDTVPGAEKLPALQERTGEAAVWLRTLRENVVLVVGHGTFGRSLIRDFEGRSDAFGEEYTNKRRALRTGQMAQLFPQPTTLLSL